MGPPSCLFNIYPKMLKAYDPYPWIICAVLCKKGTSEFPFVKEAVCSTREFAEAYLDFSGSLLEADVSPPERLEATPTLPRSDDEAGATLFKDFIRQESKFTDTQGLPSPLQINT